MTPTPAHRLDGYLAAAATVNRRTPDHRRRYLIRKLTRIKGTVPAVTAYYLAIGTRRVLEEA